MPDSCYGNRCMWRGRRAQQKQKEKSASRLSLHLAYESMRLPGEIEDAFRSGATILTANVRAARWLQREYEQMQKRAERSFWATRRIEDGESGVRRLWLAHSIDVADTPLLLTSLQERSIWTRMQREDARLLV